MAYHQPGTILSKKVELENLRNFCPPVYLHIRLIILLIPIVRMNKYSDQFLEINEHFIKLVSVLMLFPVPLVPENKYATSTLRNICVGV